MPMKILIPPMRSFAHVGQDSVKLQINGDKRVGFIIIGAVSSEGDWLPQVLLAQGISERFRKQNGVHPQFTDKVFLSESE